MLQYISDIHLKNKMPNIIRKTNILTLLGDIGNPYDAIYQEFVDKQCKTFEHVLLVSGNHEYHKNDINDVDNMLLNMSGKYNNLYYLQNNKIIIKDTTYIGSTLWTNISPNKYADFDRLSYDNRVIKINKRNFTLHDRILLHNQSTNYINNSLITSKTTKNVVLTHHSPLLSCQEVFGEYWHSSKNSHELFGTDLFYLFTPKIYAWIYGHTHVQSNFIFRNTKICNSPFVDNILD